MAFPSTPTNGQIAVVGGIAYQYATTPNSWSRILSSANIITANAISVNTLTANTLNVNNNLYNIAGDISATGNVTGNYILGNGSLLTGVAGGGGASIANGTSNISLASSGGNATVNIGGTADVAVFAVTGEYVTGVVSASGNVTGGNLITGGLISATGALSVTGATTLTTVSTGNISAGNVYSGGSITTGSLISAVGNITGGNLLTGGLISATGNVSSGASINTVNLSVSGNVLGNLLPSANITYNLGSPTQRWNTLYLAGNTIELGAQSIGATATGLSVGNNPVVTVSSTGTSNTTGNMNVIGNVTGSNVTSTGLLSATGNVTGGNILTGGLISAAANVTANNGMFTTIVNTASYTGAVVSVSGNVTGSNLNTTGTLSTSGNVTANNGMFTNIVNTASHTGAVVSVTGNVTANNGMFTNIVNVASHTGAVVSVTGNITGGNVSASSGNATVASGSVLFNGTNQYLAVTANAVLKMGSGDFTIETWAYNTVGNVYRILCIDGNGQGLNFRIKDTNKLQVSQDGVVDLVESTADVPLNQWTHLAVSRSGTTLRIFIDGVVAGTVTSNTTNFSGLTGDFWIGARSGPQQYFTGYMSNMRVVKGVAVYTSAFTPSTNPLTSTQNANVNGTPTAAITGTSTSLLLNTVNGASFLADSSSYNFTVTNVNTATSNAASPTWASPAGSVTATYGIFTTSVNTASFTGAVVSVTGNVTANNGMFTTIVNTASYTGAVVSVTGNVTANNGIFTTSINTASFTGTTISVTGNVTANNGMFTNIVNVASHTGAVVSVTGNVTANNGMFTTIVNTASYTGGLVSVSGNVTGSYFIGNGSQLTGVTAGAPTSVVNGTSNVVVASSGNVTVGVAGTPNVAVFATTGEYVTGLISATGNVTANNGMFTNIVNVASHTGAVVSVTGNITGGNVSGTALTGTLATAVQTNITSVGTLGALAVSGNVTAGNVTAGSGVSVPSGSVLFNGTTQVLTVPDNAVFEMSGDFTIEFWFYITATPVGFDTVLSKGAAGVFQPYYFTFNSSTTLLFYSSSSGSSWDIASAVSMGAVSLNVWNTAAVSRSGTAMRLFLNGTLVTTITNGSALYNNANAVGIGGRGDVSELFTGYVSTVRIVKGVGVYTSAYTPATAPLSSTQSANQNGNPSAAITGTSTSLLLNTANGAGFLTDSSTNNFTVTNTGTATSNSLAPFVNTSGTVTATDGVFIGNLTAAGVLTVNSGAAATAIVNGAGNAVGNIGSSGTYFNRLFAQATTALYADLAEVYKADAAYPPGTVLVFGGDQEVTVSTSSHDARIAGVVSTNPAHVMNSGLVSEHTVEVGLIGRVPCQVIGPIAVGDRVVSSSQAGVAERLDMQHYQPGVIIGKAVESYNGTGVGTIEVAVGRL